MCHVTLAVQHVHGLEKEGGKDLNMGNRECSEGGKKWNVFNTLFVMYKDHTVLFGELLWRCVNRK